MLGALVATAMIAQAPPQRIVSVNLCADELLLQLAKPTQIASVTRLSHIPEESQLWRQGRRYKQNDGNLLSVIRHRPDLVLTMGGRGGDRLRISQRLGIRTLSLLYPMSIADVVANIRTVAHAVGNPIGGERLVSRITDLQRTAPSWSVDSAWLSGGGRSVPAGSLTAEWMRLAGLRQRTLKGDRLSLEMFVTQPPRVLLRSNYRAGQYSIEQRWLDHPRVRAAWPATIETDGRPWLCAGPLVVDEILRIRRKVTA